MKLIYSIIAIIIITIFISCSPYETAQNTIDTTTTTGITVELFRNNNPLYSQYANIKSNDLPIRNLLIDITPDLQWFKSNAFNPPTGVNGQFRTRCEISHISNDDPFTKPNQPGQSHIHMFFGNTNTDAYSTPDSIVNSGGSTCDGFELNRSSYWFPVMQDSNGNIRIPNNMMLYYKGEGISPPQEGYTPIPQGLKMIAGNAKASSAQPSAYDFGFSCGDMFTIPSQTTIPTCSGDKLMEKITYPRCWNGRTDFDSSDAINFVVYPSESYSTGLCPPDHPYVLPEIQVLFDWNIGSDTTDGWHLSSDHNSDIGGTTMHADYFGGWNKKITENWTKYCLDNEWNCQTGFIGNKNLLPTNNGLFNSLNPTPILYSNSGPIIIK